MDEFKNQVLRMAHTLRCKGWRRVSLDRYKEISVERISGALTNAVFMVSPPSELPPIVAGQDHQGSVVSSASMKLPAKLLLRIYGPQASHLIDRDSELSILRRLARKRIGPRLFGTFENGRFEEFFPSRTLTREDIRNPETSRHIAKRLKELHEGIELEAKEIERGPIVWSNWDKWIPRVRGIMTKIEASDRKGGPIAGTEWEKFETVVLKYRQWLEERYGGPEGVKRQLVFAHNDTQYGNILRLQAGGKSPLLLPMNEHKQLVVIDFEYANANPPGFEFANHFCEWMSNYHGPDPPHVIKENDYPNLEQQRNFIRAYVEHHLMGAYSTKTPPASNPDLVNLDVRGVPSFNLDARTPAMPYKEEEVARQRVVEKEVDRLVEETLVWRSAAHAMWCAWGIIQAKLNPTGAEQEHLKKNNPDYKESTLSEEAKNAAKDMEDRRSEDEDEFDYLYYSQQRALLFWGDMLKLGIVKPEEVDGFVLNNLKKVEY
ncbi:uncharacterized protein LAJ45_02278 [Morchella importuna]|uniref:uncharacterized protein n=1 Tax=Morchella importuna TaxID=1174673 RepID=UPI001E8D6223|nr:uncharacterized protein LAJ45_02278 [Morchella importuna]KAH8153465.1 hypothetical protein LAJ45_02278 [Morchella importuna]